MHRCLPPGHGAAGPQGTPSPKAIGQRPTTPSPAAAGGLALPEPPSPMARLGRPLGGVTQGPDTMPSPRRPHGSHQLLGPPAPTPMEPRGIPHQGQSHQAGTGGHRGHVPVAGDCGAGGTLTGAAGWSLPAISMVAGPGASGSGRRWAGAPVGQVSALGRSQPPGVYLAGCRAAGGGQGGPQGPLPSQQPCRVAGAGEGSFERSWAMPGLCPLPGTRR